MSSTDRPNFHEDDSPMHEDGARWSEKALREQEIESLLDSGNDSAQRAKFEEAIARDANIRDSLRLQQRIDTSLKAQFGQIPNMRLAHVIGSQNQTHSISAKGGEWRRWAVAAAVIFSVTTGILLASWLAPGTMNSGWQKLTGQTPPLQLASLEDSYRLEVAHGFQPYWVCKNDEEFSRTFVKRFGSPLHMKDMSAATNAGWGLDYKSTITPKTVALLATVDERPVMVFIDLATEDHEQPQPKKPGLNMFKRVVGPYVLYELSPLDSARVSPSFFVQ